MRLVGGVIGNQPMTHIAEWKSAGKGRLPELLHVFGCADVIAAVDEDAFASKAGELIAQRKAGEPTSRNKPETVAPTAGKYRLRALQCEEVAAQTRDPPAKHMLTVAAREFMQAARRAEKGPMRATG
jgi:hypothetical protein